MDMLDLTLPEGALSRNAQRRLADHLTCITPRWEEWNFESFPKGNDIAQSLTRVFVHEIEPYHSFTAGQPTRRPIHQFVPHSPQEAVNKRTQAGYVRGDTQGIFDAQTAPMNRENALRVRSIICEIQDGFWGGAGQIVGLGQIASFIYNDPERGRAFAKERLAALQQVVR